MAASNVLVFIGRQLFLLESFLLPSVQLRFIYYSSMLSPIVLSLTLRVTYTHEPSSIASNNNTFLKGAASAICLYSLFVIETVLIAVL